MATAEPPTRQFAIQAYAQQLAGHSFFLVAWLDADPIGSCQVSREPRPWLRNLNVSATHRGAGVGSTLVTEAEGLVRDRGELSIGVALDNPSARRLYARLGYLPTGEVTTTTYTYVDDDDQEHTATEIAERLTRTWPVTPS
ncbi:MAG: GNAT family N-acetyltransferase [Propionibacteriales bacterium]|nr:GNAT family N-acetyltransferase [Propionibacteriales bacterium]